MPRVILHTSAAFSLVLVGVVLLLLANQQPDGVIWPRSSRYYLCASHFQVGVGAPFGRGMWGVPAWAALLVFIILPAVSLVGLVRRVRGITSRCSGPAAGGVGSPGQSALPAGPGH